LSDVLRGNTHFIGPTLAIFTLLWLPSEIRADDFYGRVIGIADSDTISVMHDGRSLCREIVGAGFAWWYRKYAPRDTELEGLESKASEAASLLGKRSWKARVQKYGLKAMKEIFSKAGKKATGRPRLPDDQVDRSSLRRRESRARLKAEAKQKKGGK